MKRNGTKFIVYTTVHRRHGPQLDIILHIWPTKFLKPKNRKSWRQHEIRKDEKDDKKENKIIFELTLISQIHDMKNKQGNTHMDIASKLNMLPWFMVRRFYFF